MKKIGILGSGAVSAALANGLLKHGHAVMRGSREPSKLAAWLTVAGPHASAGTFEETSRFGDLVILAVKGTAAEAVVESCAPHLIAKPVIDTTNPIADAPPVNGVLQFFTGINDSLLERLQSKAPTAHFVKAFSCVGNSFMVDPEFDTPPTMFICGNNKGAKTEVTLLLRDLHWDIADMGAAEAARAIEPLCMLWCIPGLTGGGWSHAFKLLKK
jgi:8-hydroxy-5-deazaflavin:NADPH oxidoreductase